MTRCVNVDLIDLGQRGVIVVASDRNDLANAVLQLYRLDRRSGKLAVLGSVSGGAGEAYGVCLMRQGRVLHAFSVLKHGAIHQIALELGGTPNGRVLQTMQLATQTEGCVADARTSTLYVGEEDRGIWACDLRSKSAIQGRLVAAVNGVQLVADVEGLALIPQGRHGGFLVASSQGDNAYALYTLPSMRPAGRFRIAAGILGATEETDGIALTGGNFGVKFLGGLFVAQDGNNTPWAQNFKLVPWSAIMKALQSQNR